MCTPIIIDANIMTEFLDETTLCDYIDKKKFIIHYSSHGKMKKEIENRPKFKKKLSAYEVSGSAKKISDKLCKERKYLKGKIKSKEIKSNDIPILALAKFINHTKVKVLYTKDEDLKKDFKNEDLMGFDGKVYPSKKDGKELRTFLEKNGCKKK